MRQLGIQIQLDKVTGMGPTNISLHRLVLWEHATFMCVLAPADPQPQRWRSASPRLAPCPVCHSIPWTGGLLEHFSKVHAETWS